MASRAEVIVAFKRRQSSAFPADWDVKYPNASVEINAVDRLISTVLMSLKEEAWMMREMDRALVEGRWNDVEALPFTGRIRRGGLNGTQRPGISPATRAAVLAGGVCRACGSTEQLEVDHVHPWSLGGTHDQANLQPLCFTCNRDKGVKTMEEWRG